jgi:hypothetical protein
MSVEDASDALANSIIGYLSDYREKNLSKPMGASLTSQLARLSPHLAVRLWAELDIVPFVFAGDPNDNAEYNYLSVDQQAEWMARKTVKQFNVKGELPVRMGSRRQVMVDLDGRVKIAELESYDTTVNMQTTGAATKYYADSLIKKKTKIAFFNRYACAIVSKHT